MPCPAALSEAPDDRRPATHAMSRPAYARQLRCSCRRGGLSARLDADDLERRRGGPHPNFCYTRSRSPGSARLRGGLSPSCTRPRPLRSPTPTDTPLTLAASLTPRLIATNKFLLS